MKPTYKIATLAEVERAHLRYALDVNDWDLQAAQLSLDVTKSVFSKLLKKHALERPTTITQPARRTREELDRRLRDATDQLRRAGMLAAQRPKETVIVECPNCSTENECPLNDAARCGACGFLISQPEPDDDAEKEDRDPAAT